MSVLLGTARVARRQGGARSTLSLSLVLLTVLLGGCTTRAEQLVCTGKKDHGIVVELDGTDVCVRRPSGLITFKGEIELVLNDDYSFRPGTSSFDKERYRCGLASFADSEDKRFDANSEPVESLEIRIVKGISNLEFVEETGLRFVRNLDEHPQD